MAKLGDISIRKLEYKDCAAIAKAFRRQGWTKREEQLVAYFQEQEGQMREVLIAAIEKEFAGYTTIVWSSHYAPFLSRSIPEIVDLNVLKKFQCHGVGSRLMDVAETLIAERSDLVGIRVGLTPDYSAAHRLYIKRGYLPDGNGISCQGGSLKYGDSVVVDDELTLGFIKVLQP